MSMLQRFLSTDKIKKEPPPEPCEEVEEGQPCNPYTEILLLQYHSDIVRLLLRVGDRRFLSAGDDNEAVLWDIQYGRRICILRGHNHPITSLLYLPPYEASDDALVVSGSSDKQIRLWDVETGECRQVLTEHGASVRCLLALSDELFCAGGQNLSLWNRKGKLLHTIKNDAIEVIDLMIAIRQERIVAASDKELFVYKLASSEDEYKLEKLKQLPSHREAIHSLVPVSKSCFASGSVDGMIMMWTASTLQLIKKLNTVSDYEGENKRFPYSVQAMICVQERYLFAAIGCGFYVFDISSEREHLVMKKGTAHLSKITCMGFACEGEYLVTCSEDRCLRIWGKKPSSDPWNPREDLAVTTMEKFTGLQSQELIHSTVNSPLEPSLLGECSAHSGTVQDFLDFENEGMVSCGADGLVIIWKNTEMQKIRRNQAVRKLLLSCDGIV